VEWAVSSVQCALAHAIPGVRPAGALVKRASNSAPDEIVPRVGRAFSEKGSHA